MTFSLLQSTSPDSFKNIRLVATDMDGTLTYAGLFTPNLLNALQDLSRIGIQVVIVTGRSAGWVQGLVSYLPVVGAIAENGGIFYARRDGKPELLVSLPNLTNHRQKLAQTFRHLQTYFPNLEESTDNAFRLTDWTFDVHGLSDSDLHTLATLCQQDGWSFTYSTVQCHIKPLVQDKAAGLLQVLSRHFPDCTVDHLLTVGDSPNDESLFDGDRFPLSVGVANVLHYGDRLRHQPVYVTEEAEVEGFCELTRVLTGQLEKQVFGN